MRRSRAGRRLGSDSDGLQLGEEEALQRDQGCRPLPAVLQT